MAAQVWGTFSVNDHTRPNAFVREVLLFDRLVLPYPDDEVERDRWRTPNPTSPGETWDPDRLDELLGVLGAQGEPGHNGARLAWTAPWSADKWRFERSRHEVAYAISTFDAFYATRQILAMDEELPGLVEAVAAFPSRRVWADELQPADDPIEDVTAADALVLFAWPMLTPGDSEDRELRPLRAAVELAQQDDYRKMRTAYHDWMRELVQPLQQADRRLSDTPIDGASLRIAQEKFESLVREQESIVRSDKSRRGWQRAEVAMTAVAGAASAVTALVNPLAAFGVMAAALQFGGFVARQRSDAGANRPLLGGGSMFPVAQRHLARRGGHSWKSLFRSRANMTARIPIVRDTP